MKLLIIYNPHAGNGRAKKLQPSICDYLSEKQVEYDMVVTQSIGHAIQIVASCPLENYDGIIASGGDGTLYEVLNGYLNNPYNILISTGNKHKKIPIGLIPNGTGNAFMKELGLQKSDWKKAIDIILQQHTQTLDVGSFETENSKRYFINAVGMGFVSQVAQAAIPVKWMGNIAYTFATLFKLIKLKPQRYELVIDGEKIVKSGVFVEVANSQYTGTNFLIAPKANLQDGLLDIVILNKISRLRLLRLFTSIYDGSHIQYPEVEYIQAKEVSVIEERPSKLIPDGEIVGKTPVSFKCLPNSLPFFWDNNLA